MFLQSVQLIYSRQYKLITIRASKLLIYDLIKVWFNNYSYWTSFLKMKRKIKIT